MNILVDLDGVLADFEGKFYEEWKNKFPEREAIELKDRNTFYIYKQYPDEYKEDVSSIYNKKGFIENLPVIKGGIEAVREMDKNQDVFICSSPLSRNHYSSSEKIKWVEKHLGKRFAERTILTKDKTQIKGDILIDDRPNIKGNFEPKWKHILFNQPYNRNIRNKPRMDWDSWEEVISNLDK